MRKYFKALPLFIAILFVGCLGDQVDVPQVFPRLIYPPGLAYHKAITNTTDLQIRWNRSLSDTQQNFKGYFLRLYSSVDVGRPIEGDSILVQLDSVHIGPGDTSYTFHNLSLLGRYTVRIWGERHNNTDSLVLSDNFSAVAFDFDPRPVTAPSQIFASSAGPTNVNLFWTPSPSDRQLGFSGYLIRYIDPANTASRVMYLAKLPGDTLKKIFSYTVSVPAGTDLSFPMKRYTFWIKAVRKDSVESDDSIGIDWSGAYQFSSPVIVDTGIFLGLVSQGNFGIATRDVSDPATQFSIHYDGTTVTVEGLHSTTFVDRADTGNFADFRFSKPFTDNEYTQSSIALPAAPPIGGSQIYALTPSGKARIFFQPYPDSVLGPRYIITNSNGIKSVTIQASFQPKDTKLDYY